MKKFLSVLLALLLLAGLVDFFMQMCQAKDIDKRDVKPVGFAYNDNFTIYAPTQKYADAYLKIAETHRQTISLQWLGRKIPDGFSPTSISITHDATNDDARTWLISPESRRTRNLMWVKTSPDKVETSIAHEVCHTILDARYPKLAIFAHEGIASQYDDGVRRNTLRQTVKWFVTTGRYPSLAKLFRATRINTTDHAHYAASVSVTKYLIERVGKARFFAFATDGCRVEKHFGVKIGVLQRDWQNWAKNRQ